MGLHFVNPPCAELYAAVGRFKEFRHIHLSLLAEVAGRPLAQKLPRSLLEASGGSWKLLETPGSCAEQSEAETALDTKGVTRRNVRRRMRQKNFNLPTMVQISSEMRNACVPKAMHDT